MAFNPRDDPAIVSAHKDLHPHRERPPAAERKEPKAEQPPKKPLPPPIPVSAFTAINAAEPDQPVKLVVNWATHTAFATTDEKYVVVPRATAGLIPGVSVPADDAIGVFDSTAAVLIAVHHWIEKFAAGGTDVPTPFVRPIVHTEIHPLISEFEKDFHDRLLVHDHSTLFGVINFCEKHKLESLLEFSIVSLSCELRGKSQEEMMVALCQKGEAFTEEELNNAGSHYPWYAAATAPQ